MLKAYRYRIYPNKGQDVLLAKHFGCCRFIYNWALDKKQKEYKLNQKNLSKYDLSKEIPLMKKTESFSWLSEVSSQSLQSSLTHLDIAFTNFFKKRAKFPKFKSRHNNKQSFEIPQYVKVDFEKNRVILPKFGKKGIKCKFSRRFNGEVKTCTISRNSSGQYHISILVENNLSLPPKVAIEGDTAIGIDMGIKDFAILSDGQKIANPKHLAKSSEKLAKAQIKLSKKQKGSNNRAKARIKVARVHNKINNQRKDFLHKLSSKIISENQTVCLEDLDVKGLMEKSESYASKAIADCSWSEFMTMLEYKSDWYGKNIVRIGRFEPSSKLCSCGIKNDSLKLSDRMWTCRHCGAVHDRDILASNNIRLFGLIKENIPLGQRKYTPVRYDSALAESEQESPKSSA
jgi:putative transposase